jgi:hypothetical protein
MHAQCHCDKQYRQSDIGNQRSMSRTNVPSQGRISVRKLLGYPYASHAKVNNLDHTARFMLIRGPSKEVSIVKARTGMTQERTLSLQIDACHVGVSIPEKSRRGSQNASRLASPLCSVCTLSRVSLLAAALTAVLSVRCLAEVENADQLYRRG